MNISKDFIVSYQKLIEQAKTEPAKAIIFLEAVCQVLGNGDRIIGYDGEPAQTRCFQDPADGVAQCQADGNPHLAETQRVNGSGQAHEDPGAHVGSPGGQGRDPRAHLAAAEEVGLFPASLALEEEVHADTQHEQQVYDEDDDFGKIHGCIHNDCPSYHSLLQDNIKDNNII